MNTNLAALTLLIAGLVAATAGCGQGAKASGDASKFVPGAFPPTLSDREYHEKSWTRTDCMTCHEKGTFGAPVTKHKSVVPIAKEAKCRSCHVFIKGSEPRVPVSDALK